MRRLPDLAPSRPLRILPQAERILSNGLTVIAIARRTVPLVELRLHMPFAGDDLAVGSVLTQTLFAGSDKRSIGEIATELQTVGGTLGASLDPDRLQISGNCLFSGLDRMLELLAEVLNSAAYPLTEVARERERLAERIRIARSQPSFLARAALHRQIYGTHPYAIPTPDAAKVREVHVDQLRRLHAKRVRPHGATLVLVGDFDPDHAVDAAVRRLSSWSGRGPAGILPPTPPLIPGPLTLVDRPNAVQSSLRMALPAATRDSPDNAPLQLANLIFGGYFPSRWVENIRETMGYAYSPHSSIEHNPAGSLMLLTAEMATEVTAPVLVETLYELGRLATIPPRKEELEQARQYALGSLLLGMSTQAGIAGLAIKFAGSGLRLPYLREHAQRLTDATVDDVHRAAATYMAPTQAVSLVLGASTRVQDDLAKIVPVAPIPL
ncbi:M16 family metallopeptidase [Catellatospora sichuanensis]|uniref:M16 family metallopeptidase n=1 Tax=Catellatospora sichuanensis TaxID=1969805 RepID=UPI0011829BD0|nr:pitrilysin family protein [Catellatospora sichuanensis]